MSRDAALERFRQRGFPTPKLEDWKYTDLSSIAELGARWLETPAEPEAPDHAAIEAVTSAIDADWLVIANGELVASLSTANGTEGLEIGPFELQDQAFDDRLADLNAALLVDGLTVRVSDRHDPAKPIGILVADIASVPRMSQVRIDLRVDANASARVIEYHISSGTDEHYSNTLITLDVADGATVDYVRLQNRALHHSQTARLNVSLAKDSHLNHGAIDIGGRLARNDLAIDIVGAGADASFDGLYIVNEGQHVDNHTRVDHRVGPATSAQEYRGILNGRCRAVWNGKAIVHAGADGTDAEQANHNL
nr:SufD family Fe-S cluster assembly protein [Woeseiaceae bacterium]